MPRKSIVKTNRELKSFELRPSLSLAPSTILSTLAIAYIDSASQAYKIKFSEKFIEFVGYKLIRGVSLNDPAYISVIFHEDKYRILAKYVYSKESALLWQTSEKPKWLKYKYAPKGINHGTGKKN